MTGVDVNDDGKREFAYLVSPYRCGISYLHELLGVLHTAGGLVASPLGIIEHPDGPLKFMGALGGLVVLSTQTGGSHQEYLEILVIKVGAGELTTVWSDSSQLESTCLAEPPECSEDDDYTRQVFIDMLLLGKSSSPAIVITETMNCRADSAQRSTLGLRRGRLRDEPRLEAALERKIKQLRVLALQGNCQAAEHVLRLSPDDKEVRLAAIVALFASPVDPSDSGILPHLRLYNTQASTRERASLNAMLMSRFGDEHLLEESDDGEGGECHPKFDVRIQTLPAVSADQR